MLWGKRALWLVVPSVVLCAVLGGCGAMEDSRVMDDYRAEKVPVGYLPLTEKTFATAMTSSMFQYDTVHMEMEVVNEAMSMDVRFGDEGDTAMAGTYDDGRSIGKMVLVDGEVYYRDEGDAVYFQFPDQLADQMIAEMEMSNPAEMSADFRSGIDSVEYDGANEVSYGPAHRYEVTMRSEFLAEELDIPLQSVPEFRYRIWMDDDHLVRRFQVIFEGGTAVDVTFTEWGEPVEITAPPADQVEPLPMPSDEA